MSQSETQEIETTEPEQQQPEPDYVPPALEICCTAHRAQLGEIIAPQPPPEGEPSSTSQWRVADSQWKGGSVVVTWSRYTSTPVPLSMPIEAAASIVREPQPAPAPLSPEDADLQTLLGPERIMSGNVTPTAVAPAIGLPMSRLPSYARHRDPLASQANVRIHGAAPTPVGATPTVPTTGPGYVPPPTTPHGGLLAALEVRDYTGPLPPVAPIVPPAPSVQPAPQRSSVTPTVASSPPAGNASSPLGVAAPTPTAPPRTSEPPATPMIAPLDSVIFPGSAPPPKNIKQPVPRAITPAPAPSPAAKE